MAIAETQLAVRQVLLKKHKDLFWVIAHACGGVIFQAQFTRWLSGTNRGATKATRLIKMMVESGLVKKKMLLRNNLLILKKSVLQEYSYDTSITVGTRRMLKSAMVMEIILARGLRCPTETRKFLENGTMAHYLQPSGYGILCALEQYSAQIKAQCPEWNLAGIEAEKHRMAQRSMVNQKQLPSLDLDITQPDLYSLENLSFFIETIALEVSPDRKATLKIAVNFFMMQGVNMCYIAANIMKALHTIEAVFSSFNEKHTVQVMFTVCSHDDPNPKMEQSIQRQFDQLALQNHRWDLPPIGFVWFGSKHRLFSGVNVNQLV